MSGGHFNYEETNACWTFDNVWRNVELGIEAE